MRDVGTFPFFPSASSVVHPSSPDSSFSDPVHPAPPVIRSPSSAHPVDPENPVILSHSSDEIAIVEGKA